MNQLPVLDATVLLMVQDIMEDEFAVLVHTYLDETERLLADLSSAASTSDHHRLQRAAHSLKSASNNIGAMALGEIARCVEEKARNADANSVISLVESAHARFEELRPLLQQSLNR